MDRISEAPQQALNLQAIQKYLDEKICVDEVTISLDYALRNINLLMGCCDDLPIHCEAYCDMITDITELRNVFAEVHRDNQPKEVGKPVQQELIESYQALIQALKDQNRVLEDRYEEIL
ncbi:MAG: hypothetical protein FWC41_11145, partial [Firmicutes bacterium]|nr:hypothetical protein [Bacillota bacterium]